MVQYLVAVAGARVDSANLNGETALSLAVQRDFVPIVQCLVETGRVVQRYPMNELEAIVF
jgi:hypothetical protein